MVLDLSYLKSQSVYTSVHHYNINILYYYIYTGIIHKIILRIFILV